MKNSLNLDQRIDTLVQLGDYLRQQDDRLLAHVHRAEVHNPWFTKENSLFALESIADNFLTRDKLEQWVLAYAIQDVPPNIVGLIAAGNIPVVAFHDLLSVYISGNISQIKYSDRDKYLLPFLVKILCEINEDNFHYFEEVDKLSGFDAVIATGSNNSARYFNQYFGPYPNIIRQNKNAVAVLNGGESDEELRALGEDVFRYFGMGCRSVSHLYVPRGYDFSALGAALETYEHVVNHIKYKNNFDYNHAIHIINRDEFIALSNLILIEDANLISPIGCLNYTCYDSHDMLMEKLHSARENIQCIVGSTAIDEIVPVAFGAAQKPELWDYADGVDTLQFLVDLNS